MDKIVITPLLTSEAASLILKLLRRTPQNHLGAGVEDGEEIKRHRFFSHIDWDDVLCRRLHPTFQPVVNSEEDTSQFDTEYTGQMLIDTPDEPLGIIDIDNAFEGFSYVAPCLLNVLKPPVVRASSYPKMPKWTESELFPQLIYN